MSKSPSVPQTLEEKKKLVRQYIAVTVFCAVIILASVIMGGIFLGAYNIPGLNIVVDKDERMLYCFAVFMPAGMAMLFARGNVDTIAKLKNEINLMQKS